MVIYSGVRFGLSTAQTCMWPMAPGDAVQPALVVFATLTQARECCKICFCLVEHVDVNKLQIALVQASSVLAETVSCTVATQLIT